MKSLSYSSRVNLLYFLLRYTSHNVYSTPEPLNKTEQVAAKEHMVKQIEILDRLLEGYDKRFIPAKPGKALEIKLEIAVADILVLDDNDMYSDMIIFIRQVWYDYRLSWGNGSERIKVREHLLDKIWLPDIRMSNLKEMKRFDGFGGINMNLYSNGRIYFSQLALVKISCPMDLRNFPMDKQTCFLNFSSYAYARSVMIFILSGKKIEVRLVNLPQFDFLKAEEVVHPKTSSPKVTIGLVFQRRVGYYIIQIYVPSIFLVVLSWLAFLMEPTNIADRLSLEVTMILSVVFLLGGVNTTLPKVSYPKASDWYMMSSFFFVFTALLETMLVFRMTKTHKTQDKCVTGIRKYITSMSGIFQNKNNSAAQNNQMMTVIAEGDDQIQRNAPPKKIVHVKTGVKKSRTFWVDKVSLALFPTLYMAFNVVYWVHYL